MKNVQLFITRHYDAIKLFLLTICVILLGYIIVTNIEESRTASERRAEGIAEAVKQINDKTDEQTEQLNRQLQALCFIIVTVSGEEALRQIDPPLEEQCRDLTNELRNRPEQTNTPVVQNQSNPQPVTPQNETRLEDTPPVEETGIIENIIRGADHTLKGLLRR